MYVPQSEKEVSPPGRSGPRRMNSRARRTMGSEKGKLLRRSARIHRSSLSAGMVQQQQTGVLFMHMQQVQPHSIIFIIMSQQHWIISQHILSPLVQVKQTPSLVISHLHIPMVMLQQHIIMPFIIMQQLTIPPPIMVQRFCIIAAAVSSEHMHIIFIPSLHFSIFIVHRGIIIMFIVPVDAAIGDIIPVAPIVGMPIGILSIVIIPFTTRPPVHLDLGACHSFVGSARTGTTFGVGAVVYHTREMILDSMCRKCQGPISKFHRCPKGQIL
jgi:hypothetical protein